VRVAVSGPLLVSQGVLTVLSNFSAYAYGSSISWASNTAAAYRTGCGVKGFDYPGEWQGTMKRSNYPGCGAVGLGYRRLAGPLPGTIPGPAARLGPSPLDLPLALPAENCAAGV